MECIIRDVSPQDLDAVLTLNQSETPHVGSVDEQKMRWFASHATYFRVAIGDGRLAAFLVGLRPGTSYQSPNYLWFCERYADFAYVDRVAVAGFARRAGLASRLYDDFAAAVPATVEFMTCEVNIQPPNESSMAFHRGLGFRQVGTQKTEGGTKEVAMLARKL
jgi:predicted GNAT superfamily acetyltransferase